MSIHLLNDALAQVNKSYTEYQVAIRPGCETKLRYPIFLDLVYKKDQNKHEPIGIVHFVKLTPNFDNLSDDKVVQRSLVELIEAIQKSVKIHFEAKNSSDALISPSGTVFYKNGHKFILNKENHFEIEDVTVKYGGKPLSQTLWKGIQAEESIALQKLPSGDINLFNPVDQRKGKDMVILMPSGEIKRNYFAEKA